MTKIVTVSKSVLEPWSVYSTGGRSEKPMFRIGMVPAKQRLPHQNTKDVVFSNTKHRSQ